MNGILNFDNFIMESKNFGLVNEDSLDDFDINGSIARERNAVPNAVKVKTVSGISKTMNKMYKLCDKFFEQKGVKIRYHQYSNSDTYRIEYPDLGWGFTYKPEDTINFLLVIGSYGRIAGVENSTEFLKELVDFIESKIKNLKCNRGWSYDIWEDSLSGIHGSGSLIARFGIKLKDLK